MSDRRFAPACQPGFTLVEMIVAIVLIGIIGSSVAVFMKAPIDGYFDTVRRAALTDAADGTLRRIARDVRTALPNSLRSTGGGSNQCFEFLPTVGGGRYRIAAKSDGGGDILDFSATDTSFDVIASSNLPSSFATAYHAVVYNLGIPGADAYAGDTRARIGAAATPANIALSGAGKQFPFASPGNRFQVIPDNSVAYSCSGGNLIRATSSISATPMGGTDTCPAAGTILVANVDCAASSFNYTQAVTARSGLLAMTLVIVQQGEAVRLYHEVHVNNAP